MEAQLRQESLVDRSVMFVQDWNESSFIACHVEIKQRFIAHFHVNTWFWENFDFHIMPLSHGLPVRNKVI